MRCVRLNGETAEKGVWSIKLKIIKDYREPSKINGLAMLNDYFEPSFFLTPFDFFWQAIIFLEMALDSHRAMAPPAY